MLKVNKQPKSCAIILISFSCERGFQTFPVSPMSVVTTCLTCGQGFDLMNAEVGSRLRDDCCIGRHQGPFPLIAAAQGKSLPLMLNELLIIEILQR